MVIPLLKTQLLELASPKLPEQGQRLRIVGEQVQVRLPVQGDLNGAIVNAVVDPVTEDAQFLGQRGDGQVAGHTAWRGARMSDAAASTVTSEAAPSCTL